MTRWRSLQAWALRQVAKVLSLRGETHVWLVFHQDLRRPIRPASATGPVSIGPATAADAAELAALRAADDSEDDSIGDEEAVFRARFRAGSLCYAARVDGRIVAYDWIRTHSAAGPAGVPMLLADDEVYTTDAYTAAAWRGHRIHPALNHAILRRAQDDGHRIAYTMARADNARSLPTLRRLGWTLTACLLVHEPRHAPEQLRWLVLGSPYPLPVGPLASTRVRSLAEVLAQQDFDRREPLPPLPFANRYELRRGHERFRLTIVPAEHAPSLRVAAAVARAFPAAAWPVEAVNHADESWMLTREPDGGGARPPAPQALPALLAAYAAVQASAAARPDRLRTLPVAELERLVDRLLDFLGRDDGPGDEEGGHDPPAEAAGGEPALDGGPDRGAVGAAYFLGRPRAARLHEALRPHRDALARHLRACAQLPPTLNHGDLLAPDAGVAGDGGLVMPDWTWAVVGPAGLSLHGLVGTAWPLDAMLPEVAGPQADRETVAPSRAAAGDQASRPGAALADYREALVGAGYATDAALRAGLPAALTAGVVLDILRMAHYPMEEPALRAAIGDRLQSRLDVLLAGCRRLGDRAHAGA